MVVLGLANEDLGRIGFGDEADETWWQGQQRVRCDLELDRNSRLNGADEAILRSMLAVVV